MVGDVGRPSNCVVQVCWTFAGTTEVTVNLFTLYAYEHLCGVPPREHSRGSEEFLAAQMAMDNKYFYNVTLKNLATPWTNRDQSVFEPLNDYTAMVIGMIRDDVPFNQLLSADFMYVGNAPVSDSSNQHFEDLEANGVDLSDPANLVQVAQTSIMTGLPDSTAAAGVMTTRAAARAFFIDGTNRAMFRFTLLNHMCNDMEQMLDTRLPPDWIRQDVSRSPGGDSRLFLNNCIGCHKDMAKENAELAAPTKCNDCHPKE